MSFLNLGGLTVKATRFARMPDIEGRGGRRYTINGQYRGLPDWRKRGWSGELVGLDQAEYGAVMARIGTNAPITVSGDALNEGDYLEEVFSSVPPGWDSTAGISIVPATGAIGGTALQVAGGYRLWYPDRARAVAFDPRTLYRMDVRLRVTQDGGGAQNERIYAGIHALDDQGERITVPGVGVNRYITANAERPVQADGWVTYTGWLRGTGAHSTSTSEANPAGLQAAAHAAWISPLLGIHWNAPGTNQITQIDYVRIQAVDPPAASAGILAYVEQPSDAQYERDGRGWFHRVPVTVREV